MNRILIQKIQTPFGSLICPCLRRTEKITIEKTKVNFSGLNNIKINCRRMKERVSNWRENYSC